MVYALVAGKTLVTLETYKTNDLVNVDGDFDKTKLVELKGDDGTRGTRHSSFDAGLPIKPDNLPTKLKRVHPYKQGLSDYYSAPKSAAYVSESFKALVEKMEPDVHQFFPMTVKSGRKEIGLLYYFVVGNRIDGLDHAACVTPIKPGDRRYTRNYDSADRLIFSRQKTGTTHIWHEERYMYTWISDAFRDAIFSEGLVGIDGSSHFDETDH